MGGMLLGNHRGVPWESPNLHTHQSLKPNMDRISGSTLERREEEAEGEVNSHRQTSEGI